VVEQGELAQHFLSIRGKADDDPPLIFLVARAFQQVAFHHAINEFNRAVVLNL